MATEIWKFDGSSWRVINEIQYMDGATARDITEVHYNDNGTWRQVFGSGIVAGNAVWASSAPSGTYAAETTEPGGFSSAGVSCTTQGAFGFGLTEQEQAGSTGAPILGTYRDNAPLNDPSNFEIFLTSGTVTGDGFLTAQGSGTVFNAWQPLDTTRGMVLQLLGSGSGFVDVSMEIREIATPANTTGVASFRLQVLVP